MTSPHSDQPRLIPLDSEGDDAVGGVTEGEIEIAALQVLLDAISIPDRIDDTWRRVVPS